MCYNAEKSKQAVYSGKRKCPPENQTGKEINTEKIKADASRKIAGQFHPVVQ